MSASQRLAPLVLGVLVACSTACERAAAPRPHALYRAVLDGGRIALVAPRGPLAESALAAAPRLEALDLDVRCLELGEALDAVRARIVALEVDDPAADDFARRLGVQRLDGDGYRFLGREYVDPEDWLRFVLPDPEQPALPLVLALGNDAAHLARDAGLWQLGHVPSFTCHRGGELERRGALVDARDGFEARVEQDLLDRWGRDAFGRFAVERDGVRLSVPRDFSFPRVDDLVQRAGATLARARVLAGLGDDVAPRAADALVGYLHADAGSMLELTGRAELGFPNAQGTLVHVLAAEGLPDDAGAALATAELERALGAPALPWVGRAAGLFASGAFWGADLERWGGWLAAAGLGLDADALVTGVDDALESPLSVAPQQALLLALVLERGAALAPLWRGEQPFVVDEELEAAWSARLAELADLAAEREASRATRAAALAARPHLSGARCELGATAGRWFDADARRGLDELAALGAQSATIGVLAWAPRPAEAPPGTALGPRALEDDLEVFAAVAGARAAGLATVLAPEYLETEHGDLLGGTVRTRLDQWDDLFTRYERFVVHYALLAELAGVDVLSLGAEMPTTTRFIEDARSIPGTAERCRRGWSDVIAAARAATTAALTYGATAGDEARWIEFWGELDYVSLMAFAPLVPAGWRGEPPSAIALQRSLVGQLDHLDALAERAGKPAFVAGVGYPATDAAFARPWVRAGRTDAAAQDRFHRALVSAWQVVQRRGTRIRGVTVWSWAADASAASARDFAVNGRPAARSLPLLFRAP